MDLESSQVELSVVITTRNRPHKLAAAVRSALQQTGRSIEVIVVDDANIPPVEVPAHVRFKCIPIEEQFWFRSAVVQNKHPICIRPAPLPRNSPRKGIGIS